MNSRERESLDRYITGNYGEDQFRGEEEKCEPSSAPWIIRPEYGKENVYRLWDKDSNFHDDTSPEVMDANAELMSRAPELKLQVERLRETVLEEAAKECEKLYQLPIHCEEVGMCTKAIRALMLRPATPTQEPKP